VSCVYAPYCRPLDILQHIAKAYLEGNSPKGVAEAGRLWLNFKGRP
jgi:hypothetical protein